MNNEINTRAIKTNKKKNPNEKKGEKNKNRMKSKNNSC